MSPIARSVIRFTQRIKNPARRNQTLDLIEEATKQPDLAHFTIAMCNGRPGVGKTLTAEALSERVEMPLYSISAAEIGTVPERVDDFLHKVFRLSRKWKVLLLLDEADVFLEQRNTENLPRHSIVAVFLRRLEYFKGILILTTNRVANFDDAVLNRIHIKLNYPEMGPNSRRQVWANILRKDREDGLRLTAEEVEKLVKAPRNADQEYCVHCPCDGPSSQETPQDEAFDDCYRCNDGL